MTRLKNVLRQKVETLFTNIVKILELHTQAKKTSLIAEINPIQCLQLSWSLSN